MKLALLAVAFTLLAACSSVPIQTPGADRQEIQRNAYLQSHSDWAFKGRVAYSHRGQGGSAQISWRQSGRQSDVRITAPLAMGSARILFDEDHAQLFDASNRLVKSGRPDVLLAELLNMPISADALIDGLRAYWPDSPEHTLFAAAGSVQAAEWMWQYSQWFDQPVRLPKKIEVSREQTRLRIIIDQWQETPGG